MPRRFDPNIALRAVNEAYDELIAALRLKDRSEKLAARSRKILIDLLEIDLEQADLLLQKADGSVKLALVMHKFNCDKKEAQKRFKKAIQCRSEIKDPKVKETKKILDAGF